jgi:hypothetical protein
MGAFDERPRFYEGQFLSAADLGQVVDYLRGADARHALGAHTWGIALGLHLIERPAPGAPNRVEVLLQPGAAWDGFGRVIAVGWPERLPETKFEGIAYNAAVDDPLNPGGPKGRLVRVWLAYDEFPTRTPPYGFENCSDDPANARVRETFQFVIGEQPNLLDRRAPVLIGDANVDAANALTEFDSTAMTLWDASVPHQTFPAAGKPPRWLIPIGFVRWIARDGALGYFAKRDLDPADNVELRTRAFRRMFGVVAEELLGAAGNVVIRARGDNPVGPHRFSRLLQSPTLAADAHSDLLWIEGRSRMLGDVKLANAELHWRDANSTDQTTPLYIARFGDDRVDGAMGQRELRTYIGPDTQTDNRLIVGPRAPGAGPPGPPLPPPQILPRLVVVSGRPDVASEGRVGVNSYDPQAALEVKGDWTNNEDGALRLSGDTPTLRFHAGATAWRQQVPSQAAASFRIGHRTAPATWRDVVYVTTSNRVGIGTSTPRNPLSVRSEQSANPDWEELVAFEDVSAATKWHVNLRTVGGKHLNFAETGVADGRLYLKAGGGVGIATVEPTNPLHVNGNTGIRQNRLYLSGGDGWSSITYNAHHNDANNAWVFPDPARKSVTIELDDANGATRFEVFSNATSVAGNWKSNLRVTGDNDVTAMAYNGGSVGVGTLNPSEKLHVAGAFLRVDGAANEQAVLGGEGVQGVTVGTRNAGTSFADMRNLTVPFSGVNAAAWLSLWCRDVTEVSDERAKTRIESISGALDRVTKLRGVTYQWRDMPAGYDTGQRLGLIAQEVQKVVPEAVTVNQRGAGLSYSALVPLLIESIKEMKAEIDTLRERVDVLERGAASAASATRRDGPRKRAR